MNMIIMVMVLCCSFIYIFVFCWRQEREALRGKKPREVDDDVVFLLEHQDKHDRL